MRVVLVTGTDTGVGKTVATAALACGYGARGLRVSVVKPTQTGLVPGEPGDLDEVTRLSGVTTVHEHLRLRDPLAPDAAARREHARLPSVDAHATRIATLRDDLVLVEGAGGLLVRLDGAGGTLLDLALAVQRRGVTLTTVVVVRAGLGTLNHTALTMRALRGADVDVAGLIIGSWPRDPDLAARCNLDDLPAVSGRPVLGMLPDGAGGLSRSAFADAAPGWFTALP